MHVSSQRFSYLKTVLALHFYVQLMTHFLSEKKRNIFLLKSHNLLNSLAAATASALPTDCKLSNKKR